MTPWRAAVIAEAQAWLMTPWAPNARVHGAGVDCGQYLIACYVNTGLVPDIDTGPYPQDHMQHSTEERFLGFVEQHMDRTDSPQPADVAVWRYGLCFSHGAIVLAWPRVIHAYRPERAVVYGDASKGGLAREHLKDGGSAEREVRFYTLRGAP